MPILSALIKDEKSVSKNQTKSRKFTSLRLFVSHLYLLDFNRRPLVSAAVNYAAFNFTIVIVGLSNCSVASDSRCKYDYLLVSGIIGW
jgi:hypothetical protein